MQKLKEINGKNYAECSVVLVGGHQSQNEYIVENGQILFDSKIKKLIVYKYGRSLLKNIGDSLFPYHIYITSNDPITKNDWFITPEKKVFMRSSYEPMHGDKKIIASTNPILELASPSNSFIKVYIEQFNNKREENITDVLVEYVENIESCCTCDTYDKIENCKYAVEAGQSCLKRYDNGDFYRKILQPKVSNNTITIIKNTVKTYTKEEVLSLLEIAWEYAANYGSRIPNSHYFDLFKERYKLD